jgi:predicted MFS family arabinose efflux permease
VKRFRSWDCLILNPFAKARRHGAALDLLAVMLVRHKTTTWEDKSLWTLGIHVLLSWRFGVMSPMEARWVWKAMIEEESNAVISSLMSLWLHDPGASDGAVLRYDARNGPML